MHSARLLFFLCGLLVATQSYGSLAGAEDSKPAAEPKKNEPAPEAHDPEHRRGPQQGDHGEEEHHGFDGEADYLALADSPIFLPRSYMYWGTPVGAKGHRESLVFGLEYALHLPIYSNLRDQALQGKSWAGATTLSFEGDLRMIDSDSKPVRMPSYRPSLSGQLFYIVHRKSPLLFGARTGLYHYSNGQEKCTFDETKTDNSEPCRAATESVTDAVTSLNRVNGNFSTNGWLLELHGRVHQVNTKGVAIAHLSAGFSVQGMIAQGPGAMEPALRRLYGWGRLQWSLEAKKRFGWAVMTLRTAATFYPNTDGRTPNKSGQAEVVLGPYWLTGLGFFARYYGGRDFYNAFFVDSIEQFSAGLAWDGERPLKFKR